MSAVLLALLAIAMSPIRLSVRSWRPLSPIDRWFGRAGAGEAFVILSASPRKVVVLIVSWTYRR